MNSFRSYLFLFLAFAFIAGCKHKKKPLLSGDDPVEVGDFIESFPELKLPFQFTDTLLSKKDNDSLRISYKVITQFIPDSVLTKIIGKSTKHRFYPIGKVTVKGGETYLLLKEVHNEHKTALLTCFDKKQQFIAAMTLFQPDNNPLIQQVSGINKTLSIFKTVQHRNADGSITEGKDVYILNDEAKNFILIVTDHADNKPTELINPIDALPRKNKLSADYATGKMDIVSIRDGKKSDKIMFFIHFEKNNHECIGELKGEAILKTATMAEYRTGRDPCILQLYFTPSTVTIKEIEGCGSHRGLHCVFEGTFPRKKEVKHKKK